MYQYRQRSASVQGSNYGNLSNEPSTASSDSENQVNHSQNAHRSGHQENGQVEVGVIGPQWGKYSPYFNGFIVLGPNKGCFVCTILAIIFIGAIMICQYPLVVLHVGRVYAIIGIILFWMTVVTLFWTSLTDPGVIPKNRRLERNWWTLEQYNSDVLSGYRLRYCRKCETVRPPRTYHCDLCDICVRENKSSNDSRSKSYPEIQFFFCVLMNMSNQLFIDEGHQDMHMFIGGICIGERNYLPYLALNVCQVMFSIYLVTVGGINFSKRSEKTNPANFRSDGIVLTSVSFFVGFLIMMAPQTGAIMFIYRLYLLSKDRTLREEYRILKRFYTRPSFLRPKSCFTNFFSTFKCKDKGKSCFRSNFRQVNVIIDGELEQNISSAATIPGLQPGIPFRNHNGLFLQRPTILSLLERNGLTGWTRQEQDLNMNLINCAKAKRGICQSVPLLSCGELPTLPGDRIQMEKNARASSALQRKIKRFHEVQEMPKPLIDLHVHNQLSTSFSEGAIPRTPMTPEILNEMLQLARATQIRRVIEFILARDRRGLVRMARRVDVGGVLGLQRGMDAENLQVIELGRQGMGGVMERPFQQEINLGRRHPLNLPAGVVQMVAAGLLPRDQGRMARHLTPENLNILRAHANRYQDIEPVNNTGQISPIPQRSQGSIRNIPPAAIQIVPINIDDNSNNNDNIVPNLQHGVVRVRTRRHGHIVRHNLASNLHVPRLPFISTPPPSIPSTPPPPPLINSNNENRNNLAVAFVMNQGIVDQINTSNLNPEEDNNNNPE